jgi:enediyne biosynthesis thioesterase
MRAYEYKHIVSFEETNLVGNVYYANHVRWQGRCREFFLRDHAPGILQQLADGLVLVTTRVSCDYLNEIRGLDEVIIRMYVGGIAQSRLTMHFEYWRNAAAHEELVARGEQQVACLRRAGDVLIPEPIPTELRQALQLYATA